MKDNQDIKPNYFFEENEISLLDILIKISKHVSIIIITPTIFCCFMIFYVSFIAKPSFTSSAKIMSGAGNSNNQVSGIAAQFGFRMPMNQSEPKWVYPDIIKSRTLARAVIKRKFDSEQFGNQKRLLQILTYGNTKPQKDIKILEMDAVNILLSMIGVSEDLSTGIINLEVSASEPKLASDIVNVLIAELDKHQKAYNSAKTSKTKQFIEERIIDTQKELSESEEILKDFVDSNRRIENSPALQLQRDRLAREVSVLTGVFTTLKQQLETAKIEQVKDSDYVIILDPPVVPQTRSAPQKKLLVISAGLLGILFGIIIGFVKEYYENSSKQNQKEISLIKKNLFEGLSSLPFLRKFIRN